MSLIDSMVGVAFYHELLVVWHCPRVWHTTIYISLLTMLWVMVYVFSFYISVFRLNWNLKLNKCLNLKPKMRSCLLFNNEKMNHFVKRFYIFYSGSDTLYNQTIFENNYEWQFNIWPVFLLWRETAVLLPCRESISSNRESACLS